ncbi:MAG: glycosyltransferase family 2 protein [Coriobacteriaceae bacterium]|jgi:glycosyltransferase involved in cell wall biosynthesis|nr:glycosyltransferase family 2 protein [Coriobacteriaceae bacterium]
MIDDVAIIIPAYSEGSVIRENLEGVCAAFKHVVCVNDGSPDNTREEAEKTRAVVINHTLNLGQGAAIQTGIEYALTLPVEYFCTFDADGQHSLEDVSAMLDTIKHERVDIVIGSRFKGRVENISPLKKRILKCAVWFSNATSGLKLTDAHNGLRVFNRHVAETIDLQETGYQHASEFTEKIAKNAYTYVEVPNTIVYTDYSRAKGQSMLNAVNIGIDTLIGKLVK